MLTLLVKVGTNAFAAASKLKVEMAYLHHYDESSECETARQHKVAEVACYRLERTIEGGSAHPRSVLELTKNEVDGGVCHVPVSNAVRIRRFA